MSQKNWIENSEVSSWPLFDWNREPTEEAEVVATIPEPLWEGLDACAKAQGVTREVLLVAAGALLLEKYSNSTGALFALGREGRFTLLYESAKDRGDLTAYLEHTKAQILDAREAVSFPEQCGAFDLSVLPFITCEKAIYDAFSVMNPYAAKAPLMLGFVTEEDGVQLRIKYAANHYRPSTMERLMTSLTQILSQMQEGKKELSSYSLLDSLMEAELEACNQTERPYDDKVTIIDLFERAAARFPERTALVYRDTRLTYAELDARAERIGAHLNRLGIHSEDVVSILIPRSEYIGIASLGVLKSGAAYQPLDASYPPERLDFMIQDAGAKLLIADRVLAGLVPGYHGPVLYLDELDSLPEGKAARDSVPGSLFIMLYTSGSTGTPKGVQLENRNLVAFCHWFRDKFHVDENARTAAYASYGFDANMMDLYPTLTAGGELHIIEEEIRLDLLAIQSYFTAHHITHSFMTTQVGRQYADLFPVSDYPRYLLTGGEALVPVEPPKGYLFYNVYGPTETTVSITSQQVDRKYERVPIGARNDNTKLYVVNGNGLRVPVGVPGELWVAGAQVARGYLNRPEQNEKVFTANPFCDEAGYERIYRTGDIVRFLEDGRVDFIGREDGQVKIRGFRIELSEVEEVIRQFDGISDATVQAFQESGGGKYIAAYVVSDHPVDIQALHAFIAGQKPPYMVPAVTMQIDRIPLNQNQKVNRRALPEPVRTVHAITPPENERQEAILACLTGIVGHEDVGIDDNLLEAGLTSIGSIKFVVLLYDRFGVSISTKTLHQCDTIRKLDAYLSEHAAEGRPEEAGKAEGEGGALRDRYPLTQTQKGIYVECMLNPSSVLYNLPCYLKVSRELSEDLLASAMRGAAALHPGIHCTIQAGEDGGIYQYPRPDEEIEVAMESGSESEFASYFASFARPFDFANGPLYRLAVYRSDAANYVVFDFHHIIADGSSIAIFVEQMNALLAGQKITPEVFTQFDLAAREEKALSSKAHEEAEAYYRGILDGVTGCTVPAHDQSLTEEACGFYRQVAPRLRYEKVQAFCDSNKITQNVFFLAVMGYVLGRYAYTEDVCFTTIYNGRDDVRTSEMMGMLVKTLPIRCNLDPGLLVKDYAQQVGSQLLASMDHDLYSFAEISRAFRLKASIMFVYQGDDFVEFDLGGEKAVLVEGRSDKAKADISINVFVEENKYRYEFEYRADYYSEAFIRRLCDILMQTAESFSYAATLADVDITSDRERQVIERFNKTEYPVAIKSVNRLFEEWVDKAPERMAVVTRTQELTYDELNRAANRIAHALIARGVQKDTVIGLVLNRSPYIYMAEQGVLKSGGAFLPMVPEYPDDRLDYCLRDSGAPYVITTRQLQGERPDLWADKPYQVLTMEELLQEGSEENPALAIDPDALAYCIYTSGSTGTPKGVMIEHQNLCNFVNANEHNCEITNYTDNGKVSLALASITFDVSIMEHFIPLSNGMTICMADEDEIHNPTQLADLLVQRRVDIMKCTPSYMTNIIEIEQVHPALQRIKAFDIGAEAFPASLYGKMRRINATAQIVNSYGPTECTVSCTTKVLNGYEKITIGGPLTNMKLYVVDKAYHILPVGISGELIICGAGVGRGYVNLPDKTKASFFRFQGMKAYHSGDLVRWTENGEIDFQGRIDNQVKIRGLRVELDEVENAINSFGNIRMSKVVVQNNGSEEYLAGYFTADEKVSIPALLQHLSAKLTYYMVPNALMQLEVMPLTTNGKIDKKRLPKIEVMRQESAYVEPADAIEQQFCDEFAQILGLSRVSADANFFEIGGTSLSAVKVAIFATNMGYQLVYKDVFANPTPQKLAALLRRELTGKEDVDHIKDYDYTRIDAYLKEHTPESYAGIAQGELGDIILTGATGFLGIHVLQSFLTQESGKVYCMVRKGHFDSCERRLMEGLVYYFDNAYDEEFRSGRIVCFDGDVTDADKVMALCEVPADTVINCAACVKHFVKDDLLDRVNVQGVKNLIAMCEASGKRLIQISTTSVAGEGNDVTCGRKKRMHENELYFGQIIENDYIRTKFLAERAILEHCAAGTLSARIIRVGNLMSRKSDGEFQMNFQSNGFMRSLHAYKVLKKYSVDNLNIPVEFSPIDATAVSILRIAAARCDVVVFHSYNNHQIFMADVLYAMHTYGFELSLVSQEEFDKLVQEAEQRDDMSNEVLGLIAYDSGDELPRFEVPSDNTQTTEILYRLRFKWPIIDDAYLQKAFWSLDSLGFFDEGKRGGQ